MAEPYLGEIRMFAGNFAPMGWALCDGSLRPIKLDANTDDPLYLLIGTTYGGDGVTTFALPDLRGRAPIHTGGSYPLGQVGGTETVTLTSPQLPAHTHTALASSATSTQNSPTGSVWAVIGARPFSTNLTGGTVQMNPHAITSQGNSQPHDNMMPYLTVSYIIATDGSQY